MHKEPSLKEFLPKFQSRDWAAHHDRENGARGSILEDSEPYQAVIQKPHVAPEPVAEPTISLDEIDRRMGCGQNGWRQGGAVDEGARAIDQELDQRFGPCHKAAETPKGLAECPHLNRHPVRQSKLLNESTPALSKNPRSVGLVDHQHGAVMLRQGYNLLERRQVSVHAEHRFRHNESPFILISPLEKTLQLIQVEMTIDFDLGIGKPASVDDARVIERIAQDEIPRPREIGRASCRERV